MLKDIKPTLLKINNIRNRWLCGFDLRELTDGFLFKEENGVLNWRNPMSGNKTNFVKNER